MDTFKPTIAIQLNLLNGHEDFSSFRYTYLPFIMLRVINVTIFFKDQWPKINSFEIEHFVKVINQ